MIAITAFLSVATSALIFSRQAREIPVPADTATITELPAAIAPAAAEASVAATSDKAKPYEDIIQSAVSTAMAAPEPTTWSKITVESGQSLSNIFDEQGLQPDDWMQITKLGGDSVRLKRLKAGDHLNLRVVEGRLEELTYAFDELHTLSIRRGDKGLETTTLTASLEHRPATSAGFIRTSLFNDGRRAGLPNRLILEFADIFGYDIDFAQDLQEGDHFAVVYDQMYKEGRKFRDGDILAAEFVSQGRSYRAVRFVDSDGRAGYYTPEGQSLRKAFIRTPVDFARISSGFNLHRLHPVLNIIRAHKGVDYAASAGTPVHATGDGKVEFIGRKGGYGNVLMLRHGANVETVYGHLSRFQNGLTTGSKVRQGQIIAFVGMTGLATAPHLHYEFRVNGIHQNPVTVALPRALPLSPKALTAFRRTATPMVAQLDTLSTPRVARR